MEKGITVAKLAEMMGLKNYTEEVSLEEKYINISEINRPALQLSGYFEHFAQGRVQIIGMVEFAFLQQMEKTKRRKAYDRFFEFDSPCVIFCRGFLPDDDFMDSAVRHNIPILGTEDATSVFTAEVISKLSELLAPMLTVHGVLVDVYGEGVLIMGESGIGKSEAALELIRRGHRLVSDDAVVIHRINDHTLVGTAPEITRHFIEVRGIGIIDVKSLYGVECVKESQNIDLVIELEDWKKEAQYDRLGVQEEYTEFLGNKVVCHHLPIRPGRNLAVICETAAANHRQKKMGYNAAQELYRRVQESYGVGE